MEELNSVTTFEELDNLMNSLSESIINNSNVDELGRKITELLLELNNNEIRHSNGGITNNQEDIDFELKEYKHAQLCIEKLHTLPISNEIKDSISRIEPLIIQKIDALSDLSHSNRRMLEIFEEAKNRQQKESNSGCLGMLLLLLVPISIGIILM